MPYEELIAYESAGDDDYKVVIDRAPMKFSVAKLLDGVDLPGSRDHIAIMMDFRDGTRHVGHLGRTPKASLFVSYSHKDEVFRDELRGALTPYERTGTLKVWDDTCVMPGQNWEDEILAKLTTADIVILLLSNDFIGSDYCFKQEMQIARERDKAGECAIVPIVVRACRYDRVELGQLQAILPNGKPIKQNKDRDAAWLDVTKQLDKVIASLKQREPVM